MSKLRVHELAGELGRQNKEVIEFLKSRGVEVKSHMSMVDEPLISVVKNRFSNSDGNVGTNSSLGEEDLESTAPGM